MSRISSLLDYSFNATFKCWKPLVVYVSVFTASAFSGFLHLLSPVLSLLISYLGVQLAVYFGRPLVQSPPPEELYRFIGESNSLKVFTEGASTTWGIILGSTVISVLLSALSGAVVLASGIVPMVEDGVKPEELVLRGFFVFLAVSLLWSFYFYGYFLAFGAALSREGFGGSFAAFVTSYLPSNYLKTLSFGYFKVVTVATVILTVTTFMALVFAVSVVLSPASAVLFYFSSVLFGAFAAAAYSLTTRSEVTSA
ncbi:hypothetical protein Theam_1360 [Thermovibrio ammonificans HB-1]|uniref:Uncharacterized protein n=1 Tax=Thermovibrio ammonificans (strain DSM 15698 / JCM 12110 / HB-1) TaxID=648996 RepID=E8T3R6_THEA1|nr:hypothetical protein [Thermovibrio ammonificans]ADU97323.1 hypothetical protein Theam_1360 [Thermovibrio ammonificans HB-1]